MLKEASPSNLGQLYVLFASSAWHKGELVGLRIWPYIFYFIYLLSNFTIWGNRAPLKDAKTDNSLAGIHGMAEVQAATNVCFPALFPAPHTATSLKQSQILLTYS